MFMPMFLSNNFMVLAFTFEFMIHFKLVFLYTMWGRNPTSIFCVWIHGVSAVEMSWHIVKIN